jgi:tetratricopeptide (TPR) repeat protein
MAVVPSRTDAVSIHSSRSRIFQPLLLLALLLQALACAAPLPTSKPWIEVRSENFTITSCMDEEDTAELAERLKLFRAAVQVFTNIRMGAAPVPTHIYAFDGAGSFAAFKFSRYGLGYFISEMRGNFVAMQYSRWLDPTALILHEYTHFLVHNQNALHYPKWFDEGFAEFMSTLEVRDGVVWVGGVPKDRAKQFAYTRSLPVRKILTAERYARWPEEYKTMFYAQAWALVHYLLSGRQSEEPFTGEMARYLGLVEAGRSEDEAFEEAFGMSVGELDRALKGYLDRGRLVSVGLPVEKIPWAKGVQRRTLPADESASRLGKLMLVLRKGEPAQRLFEKALAVNPTHARAHAGLAGSLKFQQRWEEAEPHYRKALELSPDDALNELDFAEYYHGLAEKAQDVERRADLLSKARRHYVRSNKIDPELPETYALYGATFLMEGEPPEKGLETLEHANSLLPSNLRIRLLLGEAYVAVERPEDARPLLESVIAWTHSARMAEKAQALLSEIDGPTGDEVPEGGG